MKLLLLLLLPLLRQVTLSTHDTGGLSKLDFVLAKRMDEIEAKSKN